MALAIYTSAAWVSNGGIEPAGGAEVEVRDESTGALASLFSDRDGETGKGNPFSADTLGRFSFYASGGSYRITVTQEGEEQTLRHQGVGTAGEADLANGSGSGVLQAGTDEVITGRYRISATSPGIELLQTNETDKNWLFAAAGNALQIQERDDNFSVVRISARFESGGGFRVGSPSGSQHETEGGAINAERVYENGNRVGPIETSDPIDLGGDFDANQFVVCSRRGGEIMLSFDRLTHASGSSVQSADFVIPSQFRPSGDTVANAVNMLSGGSNPFVARVAVNSSGQVFLSYGNLDTGGGVSRTNSFNAFSISYQS